MKSASVLANAVSPTKHDIESQNQSFLGRRRAAWSAFCKSETKENVLFFLTSQQPPDKRYSEGGTKEDREVCFQNCQMEFYQREPQAGGILCKWQQGSVNAMKIIIL